MTTWRRSVLVVGVTGLVGTALTFFTATPASADDHVPTTTVTRAQWGYVDRATPLRVHLGHQGDAPIGAGDGWHVSRSYFRFDLTAFDGSTVLSAALSGRETQAANCAVRSLQVWRTDALTSRSSWLLPPRERELLATAGPVGGQCPAAIDTDLTAAITAAVQRGDDSITLELRVPRAHEPNRAYGRAAANDLKLVVSHNRAPATPTGHQIAPDRGCATTAPGTYLNPERLNDARRLLFTAQLGDPDPGDALTAEFAHWPVADPAARETLQRAAGADGKVVAQANDWALAADGTHAWTVRALDGTAASAETTPCYFTIDRTRPTSPTTSSPVYPRGSTPGGGYGVPGAFTFTTTSDDVVAYEYRFASDEQWSTAVPTAPGGPASITHTPVRTGSDYVTVNTVDRAGNRSQSDESYSFAVLENRPFVWSDLYSDQYVNPNGGVSVPGRFDFSSNLTSVASYTYRVDDGPETTVAADANRKASVVYAPTHSGHNTLKVRSTSADGVSSPEREHRFTVDNAPVVTREGTALVGSTVRFVLQPRQTDAVSYTYWFSRWNGPDSTPVTVPVAADGTGSFTWSPVDTDSNSVTALRVRSTNAAGAVSETRSVEIYVDGAAPRIEIAGDSLTRPATLTFTTGMVSPTEYEYWFDHVPSVKYTVPATAGVTTVQHTADRTGTLVLRARARNAAGTWTVAGSSSWWVHDNPGVTSTDFPYGQERPWGEGTLTFTANQPGAAEFQYTVDGSTTTVPAGPDGTATIRWTATQAGDQYLKVISRTAVGVESSPTPHQFRIVDNPGVTSADFPAGQSSPWREGALTFTAIRSGSTEFEYTVDGVTTTVPVGPDGTTTVRFTPTHLGDQSIVVTSRTAAGAVSAATTYRFQIFDQPSVQSDKYPEGFHGVPLGTPGMFTFTGRPDVVEYTYRFDINRRRGTEYTVAAVGGTASITYAPPSYGGYVLRVTARYANGSTSSIRTHNFTIIE
ncbi:hypothetical protein ABZ816_34165 [Actinosynnema sp. NPDC047251]|uniref:Uncharacterized protein n=1 Tax=Saccharothrix espanaensis (strain ATCC 51144 / DSM 44229 / JCM 9112 / NBRC 15066 / NRRL 15764) TaxID=1179773 RepID=K0K5V1_SACES|nr:hypothetical protein [Saccharothrix espanaensis]CCH32254.1 hypothetical protein BN6_49850 [Saccharothrix espanaensis DSM 44229]